MIGEDKIFKMRYSIMESITLFLIQHFLFDEKGFSFKI